MELKLVRVGARTAPTSRLHEKQRFTIRTDPPIVTTHEVECLESWKRLMKSLLEDENDKKPML